MEYLLEGGGGGILPIILVKISGNFDFILAIRLLPSFFKNTSYMLTWVHIQKKS